MLPPPEGAHGGLLLGVDIGTASSKAVLVTPEGDVVARATVPHGTSNPRPGWFEHDAEAIWWADFRALVRELLLARPDDVVLGVGVSGIGPCLLPADEAGTPLRPAILYGVDTRAGAQIAELNAELGVDRIRERGGSPLTSQAVGPKVRWLAQCEPAVYARTRKLFMASSYLTHRLTGRYTLDHHSASQCTPLYDLPSLTWNREWAERIAPGVVLPELAWPTEVIGHVTPDAAAETGLAAGTPVTTGTIDAWAEAASVGVSAPGDVMVMYGTTMFLVEVVERMVTHPGLWSTAGVLRGSYTLAAGMATSGAVTDWLRNLTSSDFPTLVAEAAESPAGSNGLLMLPYFAGERTPLFDADARGALLGLTLAHRRGDIYRAALEGTAFGVRHNLAAMSEAAGGARKPRLVAVGGGTTGGLWPQIVSDVTGLDQELPVETVGASLGDALLAGIATGLAVEPRRWNAPSSVVRPNPAVRDLYDERFTDYLQLYSATADIAHRLAASQASREGRDVTTDGG